jgi:hypothetical protein
MRYVSFSLWGDKPIYNVGVIKNAELMKVVYPNWKMIVFYDNTVPKETIDKLIEMDVVVKDMSNTSVYGMFWRFYALEQPDCEYAIFRDADSRISIREKLAVDEWIKSGKSLHVMRDHPYHRIPAGNNELGILGGMWGIKNGVIPIVNMIREFGKSTEHQYGNDQSFLKIVYHTLYRDRYTHDEFFELNPFPIKRKNGRFIGERIDENENPLTDDYKLVL